MHARRQPFSHLARQRVGLHRRADSFDPFGILDDIFGSDDGATVKAATQTTTAKASTTDKTTAPATQVKTSSTSSVQTAKTNNVVPLSSVLSPSSSTPAPASTTHLTTQSIPPVAATTNRGTSPASLTTVSVAPSPTTSAGFDSSNSSNAKGAPAPKSGLSGGAVAGIVILVILVVLGFLVYLLRKLFLRRRERKRNTWGTGLPTNFASFNDVDNNRDGGGGFAEKYTDQQGPISSTAPEKQTLYPPSQFIANPGQGTRESYLNANGNTFAISPPPGSSMSSPTLIAGFPAPPPMSYNNAYEPSRSSAHFHPTALTPGSPVLAGMDIPPALGNINAQAKDSAVVRSTFTPSLPDELSITSGEVVKVVHAFDDGWGLCLNSRGEQGMVPLECLDRSNGGNGTGTANSRLSAFSMQPQQGSMNQDNGNGEWKDARRMSSLYTSNTSGY